MPIGREHELELLLDAVGASMEGRGSLVFLVGPTGSGKSALLKELVAALDAGSADAKVDAVSVECHRSNASYPLGPFREILAALANQERRGQRAKKVFNLIGEVAPGVIELIPGFGKLAATAVKAGSRLGVYALGGDEDARQAEQASEVAIVLRGVAEDLALALVIDEGQWLDAASTQVIDRLEQGIDTERLLLVVSYDASLVDERHPLARVRAAVLQRRGAVATIELKSLGIADVEALLRDRYGTVPGELLGGWLLERCEGSPLYLTQFLDGLERTGLLRQADDGWELDGTVEGGPGDWRLGGALAAAQTPEALLELLGSQVADLEDGDREILEVGAVQGRRFLSAVVAEQLERGMRDINGSLWRLERNRRMVTAAETEDWWTNYSNLYAFDPGAMQELLYDRYSRHAFERRTLHREVAQALETLIGDRPAPRLALLEIARHYEEAGDSLAAGRRLVEVADSAFAEGAVRETAATAERAAALLEEALPDTPDGQDTVDAQRLLARALVLFVLGGEPRWQAAPAEYGRDQLLAYVERADQLAQAVDATALRANALFARARVLTAYGQLPDAIEAYEGALDLAKAADDDAARFAILINLGHHVASVDLERGFGVLQEAHRILAEGLLDQKLDEKARSFEKTRLEIRLGAAAFDLGRYGDAVDLLAPSLETLLAARRREEAAKATTFVGQLYTAIGLYEEAENALRDGIALFAGEDKRPAVVGYLRALLGRLYVMWDPPRLHEARQELTVGREETMATGTHSVIPLVQAYWAELLLAEGTPDELRAADAVLASAETFGWARAEIALSSLRARVALAEQRVADAVGLSSRAVDALERHGGSVPTVRSEEIFLVHARVLEAAGEPNDARAYAERAAQVVHGKAELLHDPAQRDSFLRRVQLSREALETASAMSGRV